MPTQQGYEKALEAMTKEKMDPVHHPSHYQGKIETIEYIEDKGLNYHLGNAVKYISRAGRKGGMNKYVEDLQKAKWYIDRAIELQTQNPRRPNEMNPVLIQPGFTSPPTGGSSIIPTKEWIQK